MGNFNKIASFADLFRDSTNSNVEKVVESLIKRTKPEALDLIFIDSSLAGFVICRGVIGPDARITALGIIFFL